MNIDPQIEKDSIKWMIGAGIGALVLVLVLIRIDNGLTNSKWDEENNQRLKEMRTAQTSLPSHVNDARQLRSVKVNHPD